MAANLQLVTGNPAVQGMQDMQQVIAGQQAVDWGRMRMEEAMRTRDAEVAVDQAIRDYFANAGTGGPAAGGAPAAGPTMSAPQYPAVNPSGTSPITAPPASMLQPQPQSGGGPAAQAGSPAPAGPSQGASINMVPDPKTGIWTAQPTLPKGPLNQPSAVKTQAGLDRASLARTLSGVQGGGTMALQLLQQQDAFDRQDQQSQQQRQDDAVTNLFKSLGAGDVTSAKYWAQQSGQQIPDEAFRDAQYMGFMKQVSQWQDFYGNDIQGFLGFYNAALKAHADQNPQAFQQAFQANPPRRITDPTSDDQKLALVDKLIKRGIPEDRAYAMAFGNSRSGFSANNSVWSLKRAAWLNLHPGDEQGALAYASGRQQLGYDQAINAAKSIAIQEASSYPGLPDGVTVLQRTQEIAAQLMQKDPTFAGTPQAGAAPTVTDPGQMLQLSKDAYAAIKAGKDEAAVKQRFKEMTGQDLPPAGAP